MPTTATCAGVGANARWASWFGFVKLFFDLILSSHTILEKKFKMAQIRHKNNIAGGAVLIGPSSISFVR